MQYTEVDSIVGNIYELVDSKSCGSSDDIDSLLDWLNPNDPKSNHQLKPPTIRLKKVIKKILLDVNTLGDYDSIETLNSLLRYYYIFQVRLNFFSNLQSITYFKDIIKLEKYYEFPILHVPIFLNNNYIWETELNKIRHYLLRTNLTFRSNLINRLKKLVKEDDFDLAQEIIKWSNEANFSLLSSKQIILNALLDKITMYADKQFTNAWSQRFIIMETYNKFINKYWSNFAVLLNCAEDDHEITKVLYKYFEKQFLRIRSEEIFDICVISYPDSKPTIMELRGLLTQSKISTNILIRLLSEFQLKVLNLSIPTCTILIAYIKTVKSLLILDPTSRYLQSFTSFTNPYLQQKSDIIYILLFAILDLRTDDIKTNPIVKVDQNLLKLLSEELRESHFGINLNFSDVDISDNLENGNNNKNISQLDYAGQESSQLLYSQILNRALTWLPESKLVSPNKSIKMMRKKNLLDILFAIFDDHELFLKRFVELLKQKLFVIKGYNLEESWVQCLRLFKTKFSPNSLDDAPTSTNLETLTGNNDSMYMTNIDVMLWDMRGSKKLTEQMHLIDELDNRINLKIISSLYWQYDMKNEKRKTYYGLLNKMDQTLFNQLDKYSKLYSRLKPGRVLNLLTDQSTIEIDFNFEDNRTVTCECTFENYMSICPFLENEGTSSYTLEELSIITSFGLEDLKISLKFWLDQKILYFDGKTYRPLEYLDRSEIIIESPESNNVNSVMSITNNPLNGFAILGKGNDTIDRPSQENITKCTPDHDKTFNATSQEVSKIKEYVLSILTNLGEQNIEKLYNVLQTTSHDTAIKKVSSVTLENIVTELVENGQILCLPNGLYQLPE
ncbi:hypothetical protein TPHA_0C00830 [Tetrapisispora phaffii CBS 4417]|uniref:Anaphase-promoting complex subunit 2 n=1 Tax=Tetrapisispora phaffii (strain ATCC 24235 / CBS 4417 / NBRC 1672 / NRRL Y-8282 / UCD 70-5) TaxID=1071381 RepID=G8BR63_TETPH|nr:hypothetical protein TPHA_0C00830 [Tetrapisispora phaffii CBS 4417]CCE62239.1 hypothetical protein TPHA_0C00830 [Tetrapisispora phaffii CBS 4417]